MPRSEARSKVQRIIDADRAEVERAVIGGGERELAAILARTEAELRARLAALQASGQGDSWTAADVEASLVQVRAAMAQVEPKLTGILAANAEKARALGGKSVCDVLEHFERATAGSIRPLAVRAALALERPLLEKYEASVARYGVDLIGKVKRELQAGILTGQTFSDMARKLAGTEGKPGLLMQHRSRAELIVRTEGMSAYAQGAQAEIVAQKAKRWPDLSRKLIETFDRRTAPDSYVVHGSVRGVNETFYDGLHTYLLPPGRPRDRACIIPWRKAWEDDDPTAEWERERTPDEARRLVPAGKPDATEI